MKKRAITFSLCFLLFGLMPVARAQLDFFEGEDSQYDVILEKANRVREHFSNNIPLLNFDLDEKGRTLYNPFESRIPKKHEPVQIQTFEEPTPEPVIPKTTENPPSVKISGLVWNTERPQAIINNNVYDIGDSIEGWTITNISKDGITIRSINHSQLTIKP